MFGVVTKIDCCITSQNPTLEKFSNRILSLKKDKDSVVTELSNK